VSDKNCDDCNIIHQRSGRDELIEFCMIALHLKRIVKCVISELLIWHRASEILEVLSC